MNNKTNNRATMIIMVVLGFLSTVATVMLRVWLLPARRDVETGLYSSNWLVITVMLGTLVVLAAMALFMRSDRHEVMGRPAKSLALITLLSGVVMGVYGILDGLSFFGIIGDGVRQEMFGLVALATILEVLQALFGLLGGVALVRLGLTLAAEGATRRGMAQWSMLAPVLWMWVRLAAYEMSYASMVRLEDSFFGFMMFIWEMLFLFKLARFTAGIGRVSVGNLLFYSLSAALFALSAPATRVGMYLLGDSEAYAAYHLAGPVDFAIGVLAMAVAIALLFSISTDVAEEVSFGTGDVLVGGYDEDEDDAEAFDSPVTESDALIEQSAEPEEESTEPEEESIELVDGSAE